jgi:tetratricopeptide (TPR) repeat protein
MRRCWSDNALRELLAHALLGFSFLVSVISPPLPAQHVPANSASPASLRKAAGLFREGNYQEARRELLQLVRDHPDFAEAFTLLGVTEIQLRDYSAAGTSLRKALKLNPRSTDASYNLGVLSLKENQPKQAITYFEQASKTGPFSPELAVNLVRAHLDAGDRDEALKLAAHGQAAFADSPAFELALGKTLLNHGMPSEAVTSLKRADSLAPAQPEILLPLADACLQLPDQACATDALLKAKDSSGNTAEFHFLTGKAALLSHRDDEGIREIEAAVKMEPKNIDYLITLARYHQKLGFQDKAIAEFTEARKLDSSLSEAPYGLAVSYFIQDDFVRTIEFSNKAIQLNPQFDRAIFLLAISKFAKSQFDEAHELLAKAAKLQPSNAYYRCFEGMVSLATDETSQAIASLRESIGLQPSYALAHYQLGRALVRLRNYPDARIELERAVSLQPDLGEAYYQLGLVYRRLGEQAKSAEALASFKQFRAAEQSERAEILRQAQQNIQGKR